LSALAIVLLASAAGVLAQAPSKPKTLLIGSTGLEGTDAKEKAALKTLKAFIKDETGLENEIRRRDGWRQLADELAADKLHVGVFQGDEFAWAKSKHPALEPLALGINVDRYPVGYVVAKKGGKISKLADLKGKDVTLAATAPRFLFSFLRKETGAKPEDYFSALKKTENVEDALDDVVDGKVPAAVVEKGSLEAFRRRKPGRFKQLEAVARSEPFPPVVIAYHRDGSLDKSLRATFRQGLLNSSKTERGRTMLTLFRLTGFEPVPSDFDKVLTATEKTYPPPPAKDSK